jgi:hypothetical protein
VSERGGLKVTARVWTELLRTCFEIAQLHILHNLSESAFDIGGCAILFLFLLVLFFLLVILFFLLVILFFFLLVIVLHVDWCADQGLDPLD